MSDWTRFSDKLPEDGERILFYAGDISIGKFNVFSPKNWYIVEESNGIIDRDYLTHWMPLTKPPIDES